MVNMMANILLNCIECFTPFESDGLSRLCPICQNAESYCLKTIHGSNIQNVRFARGIRTHYVKNHIVQMELAARIKRMNAEDLKEAFDKIGESMPDAVSTAREALASHHEVLTEYLLTTVSDERHVRRLLSIYNKDESQVAERYGLPPITGDNYYDTLLAYNLRAKYIRDHEDAIMLACRIKKMSFTELKSRYDSLRVEMHYDLFIAKMQYAERVGVGIAYKLTQYGNDNNVRDAIMLSK